MYRMMRTIYQNIYFINEKFLDMFCFILLEKWI